MSFLSKALLVLLLGLTTVSVRAVSDSSPDKSASAAVFARRCAGCHTYGKGIRVGPDLRGVTDRHPRGWLLQFIRSSQTVIKAGDPVANALFRKFNQQRMPDHDLSSEQIGNLIDYLASGGPEAKSADERDASQATASEINSGRSLFVGALQFAKQGAPCGSCHRIRERGNIPYGGSLGPDLTTIYRKYRDVALTSFLRKSCFLRTPEGATSQSLLRPEESFDLKAFLYHVAKSAPNDSAAAQQEHFQAYAAKVHR